MKKLDILIFRKKWYLLQEKDKLKYGWILIWVKIILISKKHNQWLIKVKITTLTHNVYMVHNHKWSKILSN